MEGEVAKTDSQNVLPVSECVTGGVEKNGGNIPLENVLELSKSFLSFFIGVSLSISFLK